MKRLALAALLVAAAAGCSSTTTTSQTGATPAASTGSSLVSGSTSPTTSATTSESTAPAATATDEAESLGEGMGAKIGFYAIAKAAGLNDSAKMDELAAGICSRIESGKADSVGPWMKDVFQLTGDVAAKVAVAAVTSDCPEYKSLFGA